MCYNHSHNILKENERIKQTIQRRNQWWNDARDNQEKISLAYGVWQSLIIAATKDLHPVDGEPLDWE